MLNLIKICGVKVGGIMGKIRKSIHPDDAPHYEKMGLSRMLNINTPFHKIFLYVKLVSGHRVHLLELPDINSTDTFYPLKSKENISW